MLLTPDDCIQFCKDPQATADLTAGRALEGRHLLHIDGDKARLQAFLAQQKPALLASPTAFETMLTIAKPATKPIMGGLTNILSKVFTAQGRNFYYQFNRPELADEFADFLKDTRRAGQSVYNQFRTLWFRALLVGFQGVMLVDMPAQAQPGLGCRWPPPLWLIAWAPGSVPT